ncbi:MAG: hypothetical protein SPD11_14860 [Sphaerochaetaceae bacterium]|nr:hypothetical protein [Sphaerochaetaceae bacterium]
MKPKTNSYEESTYSVLLSSITQFLNKPNIMHRHQDNRILRLIAALPYLAGCSQPERIALVHMATYILMSEPGLPKQAFLHDELDDRNLFARLSLLDTFPDGDGRIIKRGMNLLALVMVQDHMHDMAADAAAGKYNPVAAGIWPPERTRTELVKEITNTPCAEMDEILPLEVAEQVFFWDWGGV